MRPYNVLMPWRASSVMEEKLRFVYEYERDEETMRELCSRYGISRETGYVWLRRYRQHGAPGPGGIGPGSAAPSQPDPAGDRTRGARVASGAYALGTAQAEADPGARPAWPAMAGHQHHRRDRQACRTGQRRRRTEPYSQPLAHAHQSNCVWCADFKGWFKSRDGTRIDPSTITDACSRYLLRCQAVEKTDTERVRAIFEAAFREYGLPEAIRTDNGAPFASSALGGLSRLAVWWIKLGIAHERIQAGHPEQNGRHERMHRTLKQDLYLADDWRAQQRELDRFRHDFNHVRPHEALDMQTPASVYQPSLRPYPARLPEVEYPHTMEVRTIKSHGHFRWKKKDIFLTEVLWGESIGLLPINKEMLMIYFAHLPLARLHASTGTLFPLQQRDKNKNLPNKKKLSGMCPL